jgi:hypothetical protein
VVAGRRSDYRVEVLSAEAGTGLRPDPAISRKRIKEALLPHPPPSMAAGGLLNGGQKILNWLVMVKKIY